MSTRLIPNDCRLNSLSAKCARHFQIFKDSKTCSNRHTSVLNIKNIWQQLLRWLTLAASISPTSADCNNQTALILSLKPLWISWYGLVLNWHHASSNNALMFIKNSLLGVDCFEVMQWWNSHSLTIVQIKECWQHKLSYRNSVCKVVYLSRKTQCKQMCDCILFLDNSCCKLYCSDCNHIHCSGNVYAVFDHVLVYFSLAVVVILTYWFNALIYHFTPFFMTLLCSIQQKIFLKSGFCH